MHAPGNQPKSLFSYPTCLSPHPHWMHLLSAVSPLLAKIEWDVSVLDHVSWMLALLTSTSKVEKVDLLDLPAHCQTKEGQEVDQQDWPVDRNIGRSGQCAQKSDGIGLGGRVPELELYCQSAMMTCYFRRQIGRNRKRHVPGRRLMNGLNSSSSPPLLKPAMRPLNPEEDPLGSDPGNPGAPSSTSSAAKSSASEGSNRGCRNAKKRLSM